MAQRRLYYLMEQLPILLPEKIKWWINSPTIRSPSSRKPSISLFDTDGDVYRTLKRLCCNCLPVGSVSELEQMSSRTVTLGRIQPQSPTHRTIYCKNHDANLPVRYKVGLIAP